MGKTGKVAVLAGKSYKKRGYTNTNKKSAKNSYMCPIFRLAKLVSIVLISAFRLSSMVLLIYVIVLFSTSGFVDKKNMKNYIDFRDVHIKSGKDHGLSFEKAIEEIEKLISDPEVSFL